jgi:hypothetical protein
MSKTTTSCVSRWAMRFSCPLVAFALLLGCADFTRGAYWEVDGQATEGGLEGELGYERDIHPLLDAGCERCHGPGNSAGDTNYSVISTDIGASYMSALGFVDLDSPGDSRLLSKAAGSGHGGGTIFAEDGDEYDLILQWIEQGALP